MEPTQTWGPGSPQALTLGGGPLLPLDQPHPFPLLLFLPARPEEQSGFGVFVLFADL